MRLYETIDQSQGTEKASRMSDCRTSAWFVRNTLTGEVQIASSSCKLRWCPLCAKARAAYLSHEVAAWLRSKNFPKFVTLTLKHSNAPLADQVNYLYACFRQLRRHREIVKSFHGGIWFFQIKFEKNSGEWHPHIHIVVQGRYFPKRRLAAIWLKITKNSNIVDIRPCRDPKRAANDIARYASRPGNLIELNLDRAQELYLAMYGRRLCGTWGTARSVSLRPKPIQHKSEWESIGSWVVVTTLAIHDARAKEILNAWREKLPLRSGITMHPQTYEGHISTPLKLPNTVLDEAYALEQQTLF